MKTQSTYVETPDFVKHPTARYACGDEGSCYTSYTHKSNVVDYIMHQVTR
jgi:hypothetical protein